MGQKGCHYFWQKDLKLAGVKKHNLAKIAYLQSASYAKKHGRRNMKSLAKPLDMVAVQPALTGKNQGYGAFAAKLGGNVPLQEAVLIEKTFQHIDRVCMRHRIMLAFVAFDEKRQKPDRLFLFGCWVRLRREIKKRPGIFREFLIRVDESRRSLLNHLSRICQCCAHRGTPLSQCAGSSYSLCVRKARM
jgi:hypothetical protein